MLLHIYKNGRPKVWCKLVGINTSCLSSVCWFWVFILIVVFLLDFLICNQSCLKLFSWPSNKSFQSCGSHYIFSWLWFQSPLKITPIFELQPLIFILYPLVETYNLSFFVDSYYLPLCGISWTHKSFLLLCVVLTMDLFASILCGALERSMKL